MLLKQDSQVMVVVADGSLEIVQDLATALESASGRIRVVATAQDGRSAARRAAEVGADALVCEYGMPDGMDGIAVARALAETSPGTQVFLVTGSYSVELVQRALAAGVAGVFPKGDTLDVRELVRQIEETVDRFRATLAQAAVKGPLVGPGRGPAARLGLAAPTAPAAPTVPGPRQRVIAVYTPKGGVGKSTVAANLAVAAKLSPVLRGAGVALLDFDVQFGNLAVMFGLNTAGDVEGRTPLQRSVVSFVPLDEARATRAEVEDSMLRLPCGVHLLAAPEPPGRSAEVTAEVADKVLRLVRRYYDIVVVDCGPKFTPAIDTALEQATDILLVTDPEVQAVASLRRFHEILAQAGDDAGYGHLLRKCLLVVNKFEGRPGEVTLKEISLVSDFRVYATLPRDQAVPDALARHERLMAVEAYPNSAFAAAMRQLANDLLGVYPGAAAAVETAGARGGWFSRLLGGRNGR